MPPSLDTAFAIFVNWQTVLFCLAISLITQFLRSLVENNPKTKGFAQGWVWTTILLPFGPVATGMLLALIARKFPLPLPIEGSLMSKWMYGGACGMASGWMYSRVREWFGVAADGGNVTAGKVALAMKRPPSTRPGPMAFGPPKDSSKTTPPPPPASTGNG